MSSNADHYVSDTDSDITVGPDESESPQKVVPKTSFVKRRSEVHEISDSDTESEEFFILKGKSTKYRNVKNDKQSNTSQHKSASQLKHIHSENLSNSKKETYTNKSPAVKNVKTFTDDVNWLNPVNSDSDDEQNINKNAKRKNVKKIDTSTVGSNKKQPDTSTRGLAQKQSDSPLSGLNQKQRDTPSGLKRKQTVLLEEEKKTPNKKLPMCRYGSKCYRKNPSHLEEFSHPADTPSTSTPSRSREGSPPRKKQRQFILGSKTPDEVLREGQPYSFFLTKVHGIDDQYNQVLAMDIKDILSPIMGTLQASCQFNYMFEIPWLIKQYPEQFRNKPMLIVHGFTGGNKSALEIEASKYSNIKFCQARLEMMYGTHHTKMMILLYEEGMRVVIHTSNLIERDWYQKTQGMWISPLFPKLKSDDSKSNFSRGDSATNFKKDLLEYVGSYKAYQLKEWQQYISEHDMSSANVVIVGSSPGRHMNEHKHKFGHMKLRKVLNTHGPKKDDVKSWPVIGQYSSIGSLGATKEAWLCTEFIQSLATVEGSSCVPLSSVNLKLIFPTKDNVRCSLEGYPAGASIPYSINVAKKQQYLHSFFHHWKSEGRGRSRAMPHIKSYCRPSLSSHEVAWFLVTSANLSKAAWGALEKKGSQLMIRSYELGVLFLPKFFGNKKMLPVSSDINENDKLLLPYDLPLKPYEKDDRPWIWDIAYKDLPDCNGNMWCPS